MYFVLTLQGIGIGLGGKGKCRVLVTTGHVNCGVAEMLHSVFLFFSTLSHNLASYLVT